VGTDKTEWTETLVIIANVDNGMIFGYVRRCRNVAGSCKGAIFGNNDSEIINNVERKAAATFAKVFDAIQEFAE